MRSEVVVIARKSDVGGDCGEEERGCGGDGEGFNGTTYCYSD